MASWKVYPIDSGQTRRTDWISLGFAGPHRDHAPARRTHPPGGGGDAPSLPKGAEVFPTNQAMNLDVCPLLL